MADTKETEAMKVIKMLEGKINSGYNKLKDLEIDSSEYHTTIENLTSTIMLYAQLINAITNRANANESENKEEK